MVDNINDFINNVLKYLGVDHPLKRVPKINYSDKFSDNMYCPKCGGIRKMYIQAIYCTLNKTYMNKLQLLILRVVLQEKKYLAR